ncbi:MAG: sulfatase-like hydrolase/transferase [Planctomycetota bacterium]
MTRPNVLMILADQHNAGLMGCAGHPQALTPHLDQLATQGTRFTDTFCQNPICTPSRVSILSSQYCHNHGYFGLSGPAPQHLPSLFKHFRGHGYRTAAFGKLHLPEAPNNWVAKDLDRFGDTYETADGQLGTSDYLTELESLGLRDREDSWHNDSDRYGPRSVPRDARPSDLPFEHTQEVWCARQSMRFIEEDDDRPFFIQLAFQKPHHPLLPVQRFWDLYDQDLELPPTVHQDPSHRSPAFQRTWQITQDYPWEFAQPGDTQDDGLRRAWRGTLGNISQLDHVVGSLMDFLDEHGLAHNTIVVYGSDHGCYHSIHGIIEKAPGIGSVEVCRVPMIWRGPGVTQPGRVCEHLTENVDFAPTLADLCGLPGMDWADGHSLADLLAGGDQPVRDAAFTENALSKAVRFDRYRLTYYPAAVFGDAFRGELYDLIDDPMETRNLFENSDFAKVRQRGERLILDWLATSNRVVTAQPVHFEGPARSGKRSYPLAQDGRAARDRQPAHHREPRDAYLNYL